MRKALALLTTTALATGMMATAVTGASASTSPAATPVVVDQLATNSLLPTKAPDIPGRGNVTLNMFQWTWNSIASECTTTIGPAGFAYVQTSPPSEHIQGTEWWTSYQPVSYKLDSRLGTRAEFQNMIDTCDAAGVKIIADTVINHMSGADRGGGTGVAGSSYGIDNFPGLYGPNDFNDCRSDIGNYGDRWEVQNCRLVSLQDLRTGSDYVRGKIADYIDDMADMGVAGFRIDAAKHIPASDLEAIKGKLKNRDVFWVHEVIGAHGEPIQPNEYLGSGDSHEFDYGRRLKSGFDGRIADLRNIGSGLLPSDRAGVFVDNHDTERNEETMTYKWGAKYKLGNVFMLSYPYGWPSVYTGYTFNDFDTGAPGTTNTSVPDANCSSSNWTCVQRWTEIKGMVAFRNAVGDAALTNWWDDGNNLIAYGRGDQGFVVINNGASSVNRSFKSSLPAGEYCDVVASDDCSKKVTVNGSGEFTAQIPAYGALAIHQGTGTPPPPACENDTQKPTTPSNVKATANGTTINLSWTASTDDCASPITYEITRTGGGSTSTTTATGTSASITGLATETEYSFTVTAIDGSSNKNRSAASAAASATTGEAPAPGSAKIFYSTEKNWSDYYIHYQIGSGAWTAAPGEKMAPACEGWVSKDLDFGDATAATVVFNNGSGEWDNNGSKDYEVGIGNVVVKGGSVTSDNPCGTTDPDPTDPTDPAEPADGTTTIFYSTDKNWSDYRVHYRVGSGEWTAVPGVSMAPACEGWVSKTITNDANASITAAFNNGSGNWDNNGGGDYTLNGKFVSIKDGAVTGASPCAQNPPGGGGDEKPNGETNVFYSTSANWSDYNLHYRVGTGEWTDVPGVSMAPACEGWVSKTISNDANASITAAFNNGSGNWDNNGGGDYTFSGATVAVNNGSVSSTNPCPDESDTQAPSTPSAVKAEADGTSIKVSWTASTDNEAVTGYLVTRTGDGDTTTIDLEETSFTDEGLKEGTTYSYIVAAYDAAGNLSANSAVAKATIEGAPECGTGPDNARPTVPTGIKVVVDGTTATVTWNASTDDVCVAGYDLIRASTDGTIRRTVDGLTLTDEDLRPNTVYKYKVQAVDSSKKASAWSEVITVTTGATAPEPTDPDPTEPTDPDPTEPTDPDPTEPTDPDPTEPTDPDPTEPTDPDPTEPTEPGTPSDEGPHYFTNPNGQKGKQKTITVDGAADEWTEDMIIAQGVANDDPRTFLGSHEGPVYDLYSLSGAWDASNLYLMWQITNVTDVVDPAQGYPISDNGKPWNGDIPFQLAFDIDSSKSGDGMIDGSTESVWGIRNTFTNNVDKLAMFSAKPGVGEPAIFSLNSSNKFDYKAANVEAFTDAGVEYMWGDGFYGSSLMGINKNGWAGYTPADLKDASQYIDFLSTSHDTSQDTVYEMKIPLASLGLTQSELESKGLGVMLISTFGQSGIDSLPHDPTVLDNALSPYSADESTSAEKEDWDEFSVPLARLGK